jgi:hypothetical protein
MQFSLWQWAFTMKTCIRKKEYRRSRRKYSKIPHCFVDFEGCYFQYLLQLAVRHSIYYMVKLKTLRLLAVHPISVYGWTTRITNSIQCIRLERLKLLLRMKTFFEFHVIIKLIVVFIYSGSLSFVYRYCMIFLRKVNVGGILMLRVPCIEYKLIYETSLAYTGIYTWQTHKIPYSFRLCTPWVPKTVGGDFVR